MLLPSSYHSPVIPKLDEPCLCGKNKLFGRCCGSKKKNRPPPAGVHIRRALLSAAVCDQLVDYASKQTGEDMLITHGGDSEDALVHSLERESSLIDQGPHKQAIVNYVEQAYRNIAPRLFNVQVENYVPPNLMRYSSGGYYHAHSDSEVYYPAQKTWRKAVNRDISLLIYLNDDYEGGGLHFTYFNYSFQPRKGDLVLFPSDHRYMHEAQLVTSGTRYVIVSWAAVVGSERV